MNVQNNNVQIINNITINVSSHPPLVPMPFTVHEDPFEFPEFRTGHLKKNDHVIDLKDALKHLLKDPYNMPLRKLDRHSPYSEVHVGDNKWQMQQDFYIAPVFLYYSFNAIRDSDMLNQYPTMLDKCDRFIEVFEILMEPEEYHTDAERKLRQKHKSEWLKLYRELRRFMLEKGDEYKQLAAATATAALQ